MQGTETSQTCYDYTMMRLGLRKKLILVVIGLLLLVYVFMVIDSVPCGIFELKRKSINDAGVYTCGKEVKKRKTFHARLLVSTLSGYEACTSLDTEHGMDNVLYWYEPMTMWEQIDQNWKRGNYLNIQKGDPLDNFQFYRKYSEYNYKSSAEFYTEVFNCNFSTKIENFFKNVVIRCPECIAKSHFINKVFQCKTKNSKTVCTLPNNIAYEMNKLCDNSNFIVVKERIEKMVPLQTLFDGLPYSLQSSLNVVQLLRDPRAVMYDLSMHGLIPRNVNENDFQDIVSYVCDALPNKIRQTTQHIQYYEHLSDETKMRDLINKIFLMEESENVVSLANVETNGKVRKVCSGWRQVIPLEFSSAVESVCWRLFNGYAYVAIGYDDYRLRGAGDTIL